MSTEPNKVIYSMVGVSKYYDKKAVLKDIYLSYFYGAKIGVIGLNGSGKSSLLRIMAGVDKEFNGEAVLSPGYTVGYLEQEPLIDDARTVREVVEEAVQETVALLKEFEEINAKFAEEMSDDEMNALLERQGEVQEKLDHLDAWDLDARLEMAMDALRCPPPDTPVKVLSGGERRRVGLCRLLLQKPDIFWTMSRAGFLNWIVARAFRGKGITRRGWSKSRNSCAGRKSLKVKGRRPCSASSNGFVCRQRLAVRRARRASIRMKRCSIRSRRNGARIWRFRFQQGRAWA